MLRGGFSLGHLFGVEINVDWGLSLLLLLLTVNLGAGLLPTWHPDWSLTLVWGLSLGAALLFLVSILLHELSHAVVGRRFHIPIKSITLFIFGGSANMEEEPPTPRAELLMAGVGPLTSILLGVGCTALAVPGIVQASAGTLPLPRALAALGPFTTLMLWLGPTNIILGIFNLIPAFPLDGGRLLRATFWAVTHNLNRSTRWATNLGRIFAWGLMGLGAAMAVGIHVPYLGSGMMQGIWLALIGWFVNSAAVSSLRRLRVKELLEALPVAQVMRLDVATVDPDMDLLTLATTHLPATGQQAVPVVKEGQLIGLVARDDLASVPRSDWPAARARDVMRPLQEFVFVTPEDATATAFDKLVGLNLEQMPVVKDGRFHGLLRRTDILRWLEGQLGQTA